MCAPPFFTTSGSTPAICQLTGTSKEKIQIKRKFKRLHDNKTRWWHIVSGDEGDLDKLEGEWEIVKLQTEWKLEKCFVDENFLRTQRLPSNLENCTCAMEGASSHSSDCILGSCRGSGPNCLMIMYFNAQSLLPKMDKLRALIGTQNPHIVCIVETWLSNDISDNEISLEGFQVLRLDRNRHGGGMLIFVHDSLVSKVVVAGPSSFELLIISVSNHVSTCKHHVGLLYHPPSSSVQCLVDLYNCLGSLEPSSYSSFVLIGDFNIDFYNPSYFLYSHLCNILSSFSLKQVVDGYTHSSPNGSVSCIDLALVSNMSQLRKCEVIPPLTDYDHGHSGLQVSMSWKEIHC